MRRKHFNHGKLHRPGGADPAHPGPRHYIGTTDEPAFENSWVNLVANAIITTPTHMYYRLVIGPPNVVDEDGNIVWYTEHVVEIAGDVTGGALGTTVFTLPPAYRYETDKAYHGHDEYGGFQAGRLYMDGSFVKGTP